MHTYVVLILILPSPFKEEKIEWTEDILSFNSKKNSARYTYIEISHLKSLNSKLIPKPFEKGNIFKMKSLKARLHPEAKGKVKITDR